MNMHSRKFYYLLFFRFSLHKILFQVVTLWYRSPEVLLAMPYATPVDLWSCGCIMAELFRRTPLFCGNSEANQLERIFQWVQRSIFVEFFFTILLFTFSVIGTPLEEEWPSTVSIAYSSFLNKPGIDLERLVPSMSEDAKHLLQVSLFCAVPDACVECETLLIDPLSC